MKKIEAVFLDLGNVLVFHDNELLLDRLVAHGDRDAATVRAALKPLWEPCHRGTLDGEALRSAVLGAANAADIDEETFFALWNCHFRVHEEVLPMVEALTRRVKVLLLSNTNERHLRWVRPRLPLLETFHHLVVSYELGVAKPDAAIFHEAVRRAGVAADACAYFDDIEEYVDAACALGIHGRVFTTDARFRQQLGELGLT